MRIITYIRSILLKRINMFLIIFILNMFLIPNIIKPVYAAPIPPFPAPSPSCSVPGGCYNWDNPSKVGDYLQCAIPRFWCVFKRVLIALTILFSLILIVKTVIALGSANSQEIQQLPMRWVYIILLAFVSIGAVGAILNILLQFFGFGDINSYLPALNEILDFLNRGS